MFQSTENAASSSAAPVVALPVDPEQRNRLLQRAETAAMWVEEITSSLEDYRTEMIARRGLSKRIGKIAADNVNESRRLVVDELTKNVAVLIVDQRRKFVNEVEGYFEPLPDGYHSLKEILFRCIPHCDYEPVALVYCIEAEVQLRNYYLAQLCRLRDRLRGPDVISGNLGKRPLLEVASGALSGYPRSLISPQPYI